MCIWPLGQIGLNEEIYGTSDMVGSLALFTFSTEQGEGGEKSHPAFVCIYMRISASEE